MPSTVTELTGVYARAAEAFRFIAAIRATALNAWMGMGEEDGVGPAEVKQVLLAQCEALFTVFPEVKDASSLRRHVSFNCKSDYLDIFRHDLTVVETAIVRLLGSPAEQSTGFSASLHERIRDTASTLYEDAHYKEAVLLAYGEIFAEIRKKSGLKDDGAKLVNDAFKLEDPVLVIRELETESGKSAQKGYMELLRGAYQAFCNVLAHHDPSIRISRKNAAQHGLRPHADANSGEGKGEYLIGNQDSSRAPLERHDVATGLSISVLLRVLQRAVALQPAQELQLVQDNSASLI